MYVFLLCFSFFFLFLCFFFPYIYLFFFFFQAEDGIRDGHVTGVQTCALPIWKCLPRLPRARPVLRPWQRTRHCRAELLRRERHTRDRIAIAPSCQRPNHCHQHTAIERLGQRHLEIGRASCRERV